MEEIMENEMETGVIWVVPKIVGPLTTDCTLGAPQWEANFGNHPSDSSAGLGFRRLQGLRMFTVYKSPDGDLNGT